MMTGQQPHTAPDDHSRVPEVGQTVRNDLRAEKLVLWIPRPLMTTNQSRSQHWRNSHRAKAETEMLVRSAIRSAGMRPFTTPVTVTVAWFAPDRRRRDPDALGFTLKATLDALVKSDILADDSHRYVTSTTTGIRVDPNHPRIEITITEEL